MVSIKVRICPIITFHSATHILLQFTFALFNMFLPLDIVSTLIHCSSNRPTFLILPKKTFNSLALLPFSLLYSFGLCHTHTITFSLSHDSLFHSDTHTLLNRQTLPLKLDLLLLNKFHSKNKL